MAQFEPHNRKKVIANREAPTIFSVSALLLAVCLCACLITTPVLAASTANEASQPTSTPLPSGVAQSRDLLGNTATAIGTGLDSLFGTPDTSRSNRSSLIFRTGIFFDDVDASSLFNSVSFRADLPSTAERLELFVRAQREDNIGDVEGTSVNNTVDNDLTRRSIESGDAGLFLRLIKDIPGTQWQNILDTGFTADGLDVEFISYLRFSRNYQYKRWQLQPEPTIIWGPENGLGIGFNLHGQTRLGTDTTLQSSTHVTHYFDSGTNYYSHGWKLINHLSPDLRASYNVRVFSDSEADSTLDTLELSASLRRRIHDNWLFFSVIPASRHKSDNDYQRDFSITVQFEAKFGPRYE